MLKRLFIFIVLFSTHVYNVESSEPFYLESNIFNLENEPDYFLHTIDRGQTVYSIASMYKITVESIYTLNPESKKGIKAGDVLKIPQKSGSYIYHTIAPKETLYSVSKKFYMKGEDIITANPGLSAQTFTIGKIIRIPTNIVTTPIEGNESEKKTETNALLEKKQNGEKINMIQVALLLPFGTNDITSESSPNKRFVEYYEGFLLALDSLKKTGISVTLQVYDIGNNTQKLQEILQKEDMKIINLIIGGVSDEQINYISDFSKKLNIPYVIPFTSKNDEVLNNSNIFQINTPQSYLHSKASTSFCKKYKNYNVIIVEDEKGDKLDFIQNLQYDLAKNNISFKAIPYNDKFKENLNGQINNNKLNVIVPSDGTVETLMRIVTPIKLISESSPDKNITLFGYPEWQVFSKDYLDNFFILDASIYSIFYADNTSLEVKNFYNKFRKWYNRSLFNSYPKYGILGFDTGIYFIKAIDQFGTDFEENANKIKYKALQTDFHFERVNNWGGFINTNVDIITFNKNYTITKDH